MSKKSRVRHQRGKSGDPKVRARQRAHQPAVRLLLGEIRKQRQAGIGRGQSGPFELWLANLRVGAYTAKQMVITGVGQFPSEVVAEACNQFAKQRPRGTLSGPQEFLSVLEVDERREMTNLSFLGAFDGTEEVQSDWRTTFLTECEDLSMPEFALMLACLPVMSKMITHDGQIRLTAPNFADMFQPLEAADALRALSEKILTGA